jgi:hypothetical protein
MRYTPNAVPDDNLKQFLGAELARIAQAFAYPEADTFGTTFPNNYFLSWFDTNHVARNIIGFDATNVTQINGGMPSSGIIRLTAFDNTAVTPVARTLEWAPAAGGTGGRFSLYGKNVFETADAFLRINNVSDFASGVLTPGKIRADSGFDMGVASGSLRLGATRGSINTVDAIGGWYGYQCNARVAFLHDGANAFSIFDLVNTKTLFAATLAAESSMWHNNVQTAKTAVSDFQVTDGTAFRSVFKGQRFKSAQQANATFGSVAHGFGVLPTFYQVVLVCTTAEKSYAIGDEVDLLSAEGSSGQFPAVWADATNVGWAMVQTNPFINTKGSATNSAITAANWKIVVKAWLWQ